MKSKFSEEQIVKILMRISRGERPNDVAREIGVSPKTLSNWKTRFKNMTVSEAKKLRELEMENSRLKKLVAEQALDIVMLKDVNSKKW